LTVHEFLGITKTHVKSDEMTGSGCNYATSLTLYGLTEPDVAYPRVLTSGAWELFPLVSDRSLEFAPLDGEKDHSHRYN